MSEKTILFLLRARVVFLSWILQIIFALWIFLLFVVFAKMNHVGNEDAEALAFIFNDSSDSASAVRMPPALYAPVSAF